MTTDRRYDIDWLRVIAIFLLLIYHIAIVFQPWAMMIGFVRSEEFMENLWIPMTMLNVWRIPLLFFVSGMGVFFAFHRRTAGELFVDRSWRIMLPFTFGTFAIAPLHIFIFQQFYDLPLTYVPNPSHLWFLGNIYVYVLILLPFFNYLLKKGEGRFFQIFSKIMSNPLGPISIAVFFVIEVLLIKPQVFEYYALNLHGLALGFIAFFFGFLFVYCGKTFWNTVLKWKGLYLGLAVVLYAFRLVIYETQVPGYFSAIESVCWILAVFGFGYQYLNRPSKALNYLCQAVYPVYIIHMFVLYVMSYFVLPLEIPVLVKFAIIVVATGIISFALYEFVIRRIWILRPLFGLKGPTRNIQKLKLATKPLVIRK